MAPRWRAVIPCSPLVAGCAISAAHRITEIVNARLMTPHLFPDSLRSETGHLWTMVFSPCGPWHVIDADRSGYVGSICNPAGRHRHLGRHSPEDFEAREKPAIG